MWEPLTAKLKTIAEDIPAIITRVVESSTRRLQDDLFNLKTENSTMKVEVEKMSFSPVSYTHLTLPTNREV